MGQFRPTRASGLRRPEGGHSDADGSHGFLRVESGSIGDLGAAVKPPARYGRQSLLGGQVVLRQAVAMQAAELDELPPEPPAEPKRRGCLFYALVALAVVLVLVVGGGYLAFHYAINQLGTALFDYSAEQPLSLPPSPLTATDYATLQDRITTWRTDPNAGRELALDGDEVNALIERHPDWVFLRDKVHVTLADRSVVALLSLPLREFAQHLPDKAGLVERFLNAEVTLAGRFVNEQLQLELQRIVVHERELPPAWMDALQRNNVLTTFVRGDDRPWRDTLDGARIEGSRLILSRKP